jgi:predicted acyltransferase
LNQPTTFPRLLSLDVFRGLTVAIMIIVNSPGNQLPYSWLDHSAWNGCTLADLVFPFFIFIVGISLSLTLTKSRTKGLDLNTLLPKIVRRTLIIFTIGLLLNAFPHHFDIGTLRFYGVLQRIALCYFAAAILFITTSIRTQSIITAAILIGYWIVMALPFPGLVHDLSPEGNVAAQLDRLLFTSAHLYGKVFDPEGFLSTIPAIATALTGNLVGAWLLTPHSPKIKLGSMTLVGVLTAMLGWLWGASFPINKALWTSSYVLWTSGLGLVTFAACYWIVDMKGWFKICKPFQILGNNALAAYILHVFFLKVQYMIVVLKADGSSGNLKEFLSEQLFSWASLPNASLLYSVAYTLLWIILLAILTRRSSSRVS